MTDMGPRNSRKRKKNSNIEWNSLIGFLPGYSWLIVLVAVLSFSVLGVVVYDFYRYTRSAERLSVEIDIRGSQVISSERVENILKNTVFERQTANDEQTGSPSLLAISSQEVKESLQEKIARFKSVFVRREFPNRLIIEVEERKPVAIAVVFDREAGRRRGKLIDREGEMFPPAPDERQSLIENLPRVFGLEETENEKQFQAAWESSLEVLELTREIFSPDILDWVQIRPAGYFVKIQINRPRTVEIRLGVDDYEKKLNHLKELMATEDFRRLGDYIDLTSPDDIYTGETTGNYLPEQNERFLYG